MPQVHAERSDLLFFTPSIYLTSHAAGKLRAGQPAGVPAPLALVQIFRIAPASVIIYWSCGDVFPAVARSKYKLPTEVLMSAKPTAADAELIIKLFDLRRETELRKARDWWTTQFWPETADDVVKIAQALGTKENLYLRQVGGYWEMAASFAVHGVVNTDLFLEPSFSGEMFFYFAKFRPFLKELREKMQAPTLFRNVETLINSSEQAKEFLKGTENRIAARRQAMKESVAKAS